MSDESDRSDESDESDMSDRSDRSDKFGRSDYPKEQGMLDLQQEYVQLLKLTRKYIEQETGVRIPAPVRMTASARGAANTDTDRNVCATGTASAGGAAGTDTDRNVCATGAASRAVRQPAAAVAATPPEGSEAVGGDTVERIRESIQGCKKCRLAQYRKNIVPGTGNPEARLMIIGEAPGSQEDIQGQPFVGDAGQLLTKMLTCINISREDVYITNVVKCRPENNRNPLNDEIEACNAYLIAQIRAIKPEIILCLGNFAAQTLLKTTEGISRLRGRFFTYQGIKLLPTYHPAALLYHPAWKKDAWIDLQLLQKELGQ